MRPKILIMAVILVGAAGACVFLLVRNEETTTDTETVSQQEPAVPESAFETKSIEVVTGSTYGRLMEQAGIGSTIAMAIFDTAKDRYDLSSVRVGRTIDLTIEKATGSLEALAYQIDTEEKLIVTKEGETWTAERLKIPYEVVVTQSSGTIKSSMYEAALAAGIDERAVIDLADVFQWGVDFALDPRVGDTFTFIYEQRYLDGNYVMPGKILAGKYVNDGTPVYVFHYEESADNSGYFDENGASVQKLFLKAPVAFKYISSGFTTGKRYVSAFNVSTGHRAIDYAAPAGTPIRAVGDGTVVFAGWDGPYGNKVTIRHNGTYSTNYCHQSKIAVKKGQKVKQGQTIGYVGTTGFSTGPHLHYEMVKNGVKINPLKEVLPPGQKIKEENRVAFEEHIATLKEQLDGN